MKACNACGKCCIKYGHGQLSASDDDLQMWRSFRPDISEYVYQGNIWYDPNSKTVAEICPWLRKAPDSNRYLCDIYLDRPEDCRNYPMTISDMVKDDCEMLQEADLADLKRAQETLNRMIDN